MSRQPKREIVAGGSRVDGKFCESSLRTSARLCTAHYQWKSTTRAGQNMSTEGAKLIMHGQPVIA